MLYFGEEPRLLGNMVNGKSLVFGWTEVESYGIDRYSKGLGVRDSERLIIARSAWT